MAEPSVVDHRSENDTRGEERKELMEALARACLVLQSVPATEERIAGIAIEVARLTGDVSAHAGHLSYYDEPLHYAVLLRDEASDE